MGLFTKDIKSMEDLMLHELQDIYYAENQITKALPKLVDKATNRDLKQALKSHLEETKKQIEREQAGLVGIPRHIRSLYRRWRGYTGTSAALEPFQPLPTAEPADQGEAILEVNCVFGGVEIRVPETWHVHSRNLPVFGGYEDKTRHPNNPAVGSPKTLIVTGMVVFGGIEIKN